MKSKIMPSLVLTIICAAAALLLVFAYELTKENIGLKGLCYALIFGLIILPGAILLFVAVLAVLGMIR